MDCFLVTSNSHFDPGVEIFENTATFNLKVGLKQRMGTLFDIYRKINIFKPHVVICDMPSRIPQCLLVYFLLISRPGLLAIDDIVPHDAIDTPSRLVGYLQKTIVARARGIITFSQNSGNLARQKYSKKAVFPVPLVTEISTFSYFRPMAKEARANFAMFGRWSDYKGFDLGIEYFKSYKAKYPSDSILEIWCSGLDAPTEEDSNIIWKSFTSFSWQSLVESLPSYKAILIPYRSASQSGVQNLSWDAGVPCLISNLPGLIELQPPHLPAISTSDLDSWINAIHDFDQGLFSEKIAVVGQAFSKSIRAPEKVVEELKSALLWAIRRS